MGPEVIGNLHMTRHLIREYGLKSTEKADSSCNQRNCSRSNGADWNGNFGNRGGRGGNNTPDVVIAVDALAARNTRRL